MKRIDNRKRLLDDSKDEKIVDEGSAKKKVKVRSKSTVSEAFLYRKKLLWF